MFSGYVIKEVTKKECVELLTNYHYLTGISRGFKSGVNFGLFSPKGELVGVCIYTGFPVPELAVGMLGLPRDQQEGLYELSRLVIYPSEQIRGRNITSWFVARTLRLLKRNYSPRVVLSYADCDYHSGIIYQACNFKYFGKSSPRSDFWEELEDGTFKKHSRGPTKGKKGEWRPRSQKHRYAIKFDKKLTIKWEEEKFPKNN